MGVTILEKAIWGQVYTDDRKCMEAKPAPSPLLPFPFPSTLGMQVSTCIPRGMSVSTWQLLLCTSSRSALLPAAHWALSACATGHHLEHQENSSPGSAAVDAKGMLTWSSTMQLSKKKYLCDRLC